MIALLSGRHQAEPLPTTGLRPIRANPSRTISATTGSPTRALSANSNGGEHEDVAVIAESRSHDVLELDAPAPTGCGDHREVDVARLRCFPTGDGPEKQHCIHVRIDHLGNRRSQRRHRIEQSPQWRDRRVRLVDLVNAGPPYRAGRDQPEARECLQRILNGPQAVLVADHPINLPAGQRLARAQ